ncbi:MAG: hypothetical protein KF833_17800 [Verrucomicrobiae bacterium]|nr:hypothetical protein [Verrucomicrobiae bacterium]
MIMNRILNSLLFAALALLIGPGCGESHHHHHPSGGGHRHASPRGGVAVELGDHQFHLDVLHDREAGVLGVWVMDAHAEHFVRVPWANLDLTVQAGSEVHALSLVPVANDATGETAGNTSQFRAEAEWLKGLERFTATVPAIEIRGQRFSDVRFEYPER